MVSFAICQEPPGGKLPATEILKQLPPSDSFERDEKVLEFFEAGHIPTFYQHWCSVPVKGKKLVGIVYVLPDFLCLGTDEDFVRARVNPGAAEKIGYLIGGQLPTSKMVDDIHAAAQKITAITWGEDFHKKWEPDASLMPKGKTKGKCYGSSMLYTARWPAQDARVKEAFDEEGYKLSRLLAGHLKNVVIGKGMDHKFDKNAWMWKLMKPEDQGKVVGIYGWFKSDGSVIQGPNPNWTSHPIPYADYSHGTRFVYKEMMIGADVVSVDDVLRDKERCDLLSREGPLVMTHYPVD